MRRRRPEDSIQRAVFQHFKIRAAPGVMAWHTPLGGYRKPVEAKILSGLGVQAGVPDIIAVRASNCPQCGFGPLGIVYGLELKTEGGRPTEAQSLFISRIHEFGGYAAVATGIDQALRCLEAWKLLLGKAS